MALMTESLETLPLEGILYEEDLISSICRESFYDFLVEFWGVLCGDPMVENWHMKYLCQELQTVAERVFRGERKEYDLVINVPPGSSKSTICSQAFPAWVWTRMPGAKFICGSYAHPVALKDSLKTRDVVLSEKYQRCFQPAIQLREDENTKGLFTNTRMGSRLAVSVGGYVTGYHAHFLLVDDPINPMEAFSDQMLKIANRWMSTTLPSRKVDKEVSVTILIQQRVHQSDPSGEMLLRNPGKVKLIKLPGELTEGVQPCPPEVSQFYQDGLLDPIRLSRRALDDLKADLGAYGYASQILQEPVPLGGGMFEVEKIQLVDEVEFPIVRRVRAWDKAGTADGGAYSVGVLMGQGDQGQYVILDVVRGQWGSAKREAMIRQVAEMDGEEVEVVIEVEGGSGGVESGENTIANLAGYRVKAVHPTGAKEARAYPFSSQVGGGRVYCLKRKWTRDYLDELRFFPASRYKDQVDASSLAFNRLVKRKKRVGGLKL